MLVIILKEQEIEHCYRDCQVSLIFNRLQRNTKQLRIFKNIHRQRKQSGWWKRRLVLIIDAGRHHVETRRSVDQFFFRSTWKCTCEGIEMTQWKVKEDDSRRGRYVLTSKMKASGEYLRKVEDILCVCTLNCNFHCQTWLCLSINFMQWIIWRKRKELSHAWPTITEGIYKAMKHKQHSSNADLFWRWFFLYLLIFLRNIHLERKNAFSSITKEASLWNPIFVLHNVGLYNVQRVLSEVHKQKNAFQYTSYLFN